MVALKFCKDTINFWVNKFFGSTVWVGNTALSFKDENTALAKIVWRGLWQLVLGRIVAIAPIDSTWWIDVEFGGGLPRPTPRGSSLCYCYLQVALQAAPSRAWNSPHYAISDGGWEADRHQSRIVSDDLLTPHFLPSCCFFSGLKFVTKKEPCFLGKALDDAI